MKSVAQKNCLQTQCFSIDQPRRELTDYLSSPLAEINPDDALDWWKVNSLFAAHSYIANAFLQEKSCFVSYYCTDCKGFFCNTRLINFIRACILKCASPLHRLLEFTRGEGLQSLANSEGWIQKQHSYSLRAGQYHRIDILN